jgi:hypothetical protein
MKAFILSVAVAVVMAVGASMVLETYQKPAETAFRSETGVRL